MKKQIQNLLAFLLIAFFAFTNAQAINLSFNGDIEKLNGDKNEKTCNTGDQFLLGLSDAHVDGKELSILLTLTDVKNDVSKLIEDGRPCIGFEESYNGYGENNLKFLLKNTDNVPGEDAYIDANFTIIEKRDDNQHIPVEVDNVSFTAFDLDRTNGSGSNKDTIYFTAPQINLSEEAMEDWGDVSGLRLEYKNDVSEQERLLFGPYESRVVGRNEDCDADHHEECKAGGTFFKASTFSLKIHNKNAFSGSISTSKARRLFVISFLEGEAPVSIASISDANATEGNVLTHSVTMTRKSTSASEFSFSIKDNETTVGEDYNTIFSFSNNVTYDGADIHVPKGVTTFDVGVTSKIDDVADNAETYTIKIKDKTAKGTITDTQAPEVTVSSPSVIEGGKLVFDVNLSMKSTEDIHVKFFVQNTSTANRSQDYEYIAVSSIKIDADTLGKQFIIQTKDDDVKEALKEYIDLTANIVSGRTSNKFVNVKGTILDNDRNIGVERVGNGSANEGVKLWHSVTMSGISEEEESYEFTIQNVTTSNEDYNPIPTFYPKRVKYNNGMISVPKGISEFLLLIQSNIDTDYETEDENYTITIGGKEATGTILKDCRHPAELHDDKVTHKILDKLPDTINILKNDSSRVVASTIKLYSNVPNTKGNGTKELVVPNEGTWTVNDTGILLFTPLKTSKVQKFQPTVITYTAIDNNGLKCKSATAQIVYNDDWTP